MNGGAVRLFLCAFALVDVVRSVQSENPCLALGVDPNGGLVPHESDCHYFYMCTHGKPVEFECPDDLEFNPNKKICDWPEEAGCTLNVAPCKPPGAPVCPAHDVNKPPAYFPHEKDCRKFYQCDWEVPHEHVCPDGLHFNTMTNVCDYPDQANCICKPKCGQ